MAAYKNLKIRQAIKKHNHKFFSVCLFVLYQKIFYDTLLFFFLEIYVIISAKAMPIPNMFLMWRVSQ